MKNEVQVARPQTAVTVSFDQMERMAQSVAKSQLFGMKTPEQALALMLVAQAEGRHPASVASEYHIIQGRPALKADTLLARFQSVGGKVEWTEYTDTKVAGLFSHPSSPRPVLIDWDINRAKLAGLQAKDNWKNYPRAMMRARCISEGVRTCYPGVAVGMYTVEEVADMEPVNVTPTVTTAQAAQEVAATNALTELERYEHIDAMQKASTSAELATAFAAAWKHAGEARDKGARDAFKATYDACNAKYQPKSANEVI